MDLPEVFYQGSLKDGASRSYKIIASVPELLQQCFTVFYTSEVNTCHRCAWVLQFILDDDPKLLHPYIPEMIAQMKRLNHISGVYRNILRVWSLMDIPEEAEGEVLDIAFEYFTSPERSVAMRVFAMTICTNLAFRHPDLIPEVQAIILEHWDHTTPAWRSRGKKELK
ncbi:MAG: hypothetical protein AAFQ02_09560 [Bacteroidota bacterium]